MQFVNISAKVNIVRYRALFLSLLFAFAPLHAFASADLSVLPSSGTHNEGDTFTATVQVTSNNQSINAVSGTVLFPKDKLSVKSISKDGSIVKLWAEEPAYSNANGTVKFEGVILNPGFSDTKGKVLTITFVAKKQGTADVTLDAGQVLANDGNASNVIRNFNDASYMLQAADAKEAITSPSVDAPAASVPSQKPVITSSTHPDQNAWYSSRDVSFSWNVPNGVSAVSTLYGTNPDSIPNKIYTPPISEKSFTTDADGVQYMHVQFKTASGWGDVAHFRFQVDTVAPTHLSASIPDGAVTSSPHPNLLVTAEDALSGLKAIYVSIDNQATTTFEINASSLYKLPDQAPGKHTATVSVSDKAGNITSTTVTYSVISIDAPKVTEYTKYAEKGDVLKVEGTTYPLSTVQVAYLNVKTNELTVASTQSKEDGSFLLLVTDSLGAGVYQMKARVIDRQGAESSYTESFVVSVENQSFVRVGMFIMNWLSLILIIILATLLIAATLWYSVLQFKRFRRGVHRTIKDVENTLKANVQALRRDTEEFHTVLVKAQKKRELTKEEQSILKKFKKRLDITEQEIEKKLEQIG